MRQIKTHYNKVIGNEIIIRQVAQLGVKMKLEEVKISIEGRANILMQLLEAVE